MNKTIKYITLGSILISAVMMASGVAAASASLSVDPATGSKVVGSVFNATVFINPADNKACVVKGIIDFQGLECQSISMGSGLMPQVSPTCAQPNFTIGIQNCATAETALFTVSVKASAVGMATLGLTNNRVIGSGVEVPSVTTAGVYTITAAVPPPAPKPNTNTNSTITPQTTEEQPTTNDSSVTTVQDSGLAQVAGAEVSGSGFGSWIRSYWMWLLLIILAIGGYMTYRHISKKDKVTGTTPK